MDFDQSQTELSLMTAVFSFAYHIWHDGRFLLGLSCEGGCACLSLVVSSIEQYIGKRKYLGQGAWEAAGASTRGKGGCIILSVGKKPMSCGDCCRFRPLVNNGSQKGTCISGIFVAMTDDPVAWTRVEVAAAIFDRLAREIHYS